MPNESQRWLVKQYILAQLSAIAPPLYFNTARYVRMGHVPIEQLSGDTECPAWTFEDQDASTIAEERSVDRDRAFMLLSIRAYKKTEFTGREQWQDREREAERLLRDTWKAVMQNPSMNCNAETVEVTTPTRCSSIEGMPGWVVAEMTIFVTIRISYLEP